jgi:hypothetical protein
MTPLESKYVRVLLASTTAGAYLVLVCVAAACLLVHAALSGGHDHHTQHSTHSPLCAWACQATSSVGVVSESQVATAWLSERAFPSVSSTLYSHVMSDHIRARAPPRIVLS